MTTTDDLLAAAKLLAEADAADLTSLDDAIGRHLDAVGRTMTDKDFDRAWQIRGILRAAV